MSKIAVAGASGVVGSAALERFLQDDHWEAVAVSRRRPDIDTDRDFEHLPLDLRDAEATRQGLDQIDGITHLLYTAVFEKPGLIEGWQEADQMQTNLAMLQNTLQPLIDKGTLEQVTILQGTKAYGIHLHPMPVPARERYPRDDHANFYWLQEDYLKEQASTAGFRWSILRPQLIIGSTIGAVMNLAPVIGVYAAIQKELGEPFSFPGGVPYAWELVDSRVVAAACEFAATDPAADGQHYNVTNGEVFTWRELWPALADQLGVEPGPDNSVPMAEYLPAHEEVWARVVEKQGLRPNSLASMLGESHYYADFCFAYGAEEPPPSAFVSAIKLRKAGVCETYDSEETVRHWIGWMQQRQILPA